ncbi:MAG: hypothetical protein BZY80_06860 [SAR202 cluster bacterium Io17-Chloro-G2]|nr:MAG: hypothetical protein BZY80_06860 [SAR202 cluster bacterium Io17-Chloro-G2]
MKKHFRFQLRKSAAVLMIGGILLAPLASHGCDAKGSSPKLEAPITAVQHLAESQTTAGSLLPVLSRLV